jgi:hypothetical protein
MLVKVESMLPMLEESSSSQNAGEDRYAIGVMVD